ncbi:autotransporter assembly complex protein TamB [Halomonas cerina]|uniref:Translocation and assembly module TamB n=1 Tax=Halomonas cerina TaxID=447424 RepID=A0A839V5R7_9GAMM|nr:translocation/assembly module TamB domain-containing protein [Halomonas cerina]MBB3189135.1 translocation and assembly module TamB [Halomonas cerina]
MRARPLIWALARLFILLPLWLLGLLLLLLGLALSPWGFGVLATQGERLGLYELETIHGAPLDTLVVEGLRLEAGMTRIAVSRFELAWAEDCLLDGRLCIDTLALDGARLRLGQAEPSPEAPSAETSESPGAVALPFPVALRSLALTDVSLRLADGTHLTWERFTSGAVAEQDTLTLLPTRLVGTRLTLPLSPGTRLSLSEAEQEETRLSATAIDAAIAARSPLPAAIAAEQQGMSATPLAEQPRRDLPDITLPLAVEVPELVVEDTVIDGAVAYRVERLLLRLFAREHRVTLEPLAVATPDADAELEASIELRDDYPLRARLATDLTLPERLPALAGERIELDLAGSLADLQVDLTATGPVEAHLAGRLDVLDPTLPFNVALTSDALQWPLPGAEQVPPEDAAPAEKAAASTDDEAGVTPPPWRVEALSARVEGSLTGYHAAVSLQAEGPELPRMRLALTGDGDLEHFAWTPLALTLIPGDASLVSRGRADWSDGLDMDALMRLDNLDPGRFVDGFDGRLDGDVALAFRQQEDGWRVQVPTLDVTGTLAERDLSLKASLAGNSDLQWRVDTLDFRQGDNRVSASGTVSDTILDLAGDIDLPSLDSLYPALDGRLTGRFTTAGRLDAPELDLTLTGRELAFAEHRVARLDIDGEVAGLEDPQLTVTLTAGDLAVAGQRLTSLDLALDGRLSDHRLRLAADAAAGMPVSRLALALAGGLDSQRERYRGELMSLDVDSEVGNLRLAEGLAFEANLPAAAVSVAPFCLRRQQGGALCLVEPLEASAEQGGVVLALRELPMDPLTTVMPPGWSIEGRSEGNVRLAWSQGGASWQAEADLASQADIRGEDAYGQPWSVPGTSLDLTLAASETRADLAVALGLADRGELDLDLAIQDPLGAGRLDGRLRVQDLRLAPYRPLAAGLDSLAGGLDGDIRLLGSRETPRLDGRLTLSGLQAAGLGLPIEVRDGELTVELDGDRADIDGFLAAERGRLNISGGARWPSLQTWQANLDLQAREAPLQAALPGFGRLRLAPDLRIRANPERLQVRGEVQIPWARLEVGDVPATAMAPSPDEVIITREEDQQQAQATPQDAPGADTAERLAEAGMAVDVRITLVLGPDMQLSAYGLESSLEGNLEVQQSSGPVQLFGDVSLVDGRFRAFGQDLFIREGLILFSGPPGQPLLDFEAIRNPAATQDEVIAGLRVTGPAASPRLEIFSEPAMDEARALSYLLRGRAPDDSGGADGALTSALIGLTIGQTGGAVGALGEAFGIQDLSLETAGSGEESQVVVTGNLTDRLSVGYGVGVFSPIAELTLRYQLWRNLYVEAVSGVSQAVDLVYRFSLPGNPPDP